MAEDRNEPDKLNYRNPTIHQPTVYLRQNHSATIAGRRKLLANLDSLCWSSRQLLTKLFLLSWKHQPISIFHSLERRLSVFQNLLVFDIWHTSNALHWFDVNGSRASYELFTGSLLKTSSNYLLFAFFPRVLYARAWSLPPTFRNARFVVAYRIPTT